MLDILEGKYRIVKELGKGGMSTVYLAENIRLGTLWAIKALYKNPSSGIDILAEPNVLKRLMHPALPRIFDILEDDERILLVMDYIEGEALDVCLSRKGSFEEEQVIKWAIELCRVLDYLHHIQPKPIIYRDMKPSNIILTPEGDIKLVDFGIAREFRQEGINDTVYIGTRGYAAPEQYGRGQSDVTTDIYSLGITLHHLLTGKSPNIAPFEILPVRYYQPRCSREVERILQKCTSRESQERYQSAEELRRELELVLGKPEAAETIARDPSRKGEYGGVTEPGFNSDGSYGDTGAESTEAMRCGGWDNLSSFRRLVLGICGNSGFAGELGYILARGAGLKVLIVDLDAFSSYLDLVLKVDLDGGLHKGLYLKGGEEESLGTMSQAEIQRLIEGYSMEVLKDGRLSILRCVVKPGEREGLDIGRLVEAAYRSHDVTLLSLGHWVEDPLARKALGLAELVILPTGAGMSSLRAVEQGMAYLEELGTVHQNQIRYVAWNYQKETDLPVKTLHRMFPGSTFLGCISYAPERERLLNEDEIPYVKQEYEKLKEEYQPVLDRLGIRTAAKGGFPPMYSYSLIMKLLRGRQGRKP